MQIQTIQTKPYSDQKPGTSGLRKKTKTFIEQTHYLQNFIQSIFNTIDAKNKTLVLGGDGRYFNDQAIQIILKMAIANQVQKIIVGQKGFMSTPAVSVEIRKNKTDGGIILSASHNPGGIDGDFGIKFNGPNGAPASESIANAIYEETLKITSYKIAEMPDINLSEIQNYQIENTQINIIDPVANYANLMAEIFDFDAISHLFKSGFKMRYDALNAITGPYAKEILENRLGAPTGTVVNEIPLPNFGGKHPDPNLTYAKDLVDIMYSKDAPDMGAASDGDGDRNMILGKHFFVNPSDSIAVLVDNAHLTKGYKEQISGVARSMPTSKALDKVAQVKGMSFYEVPTGWRFFGNLMDDNRIVFCGEESFGTGSNHIREKDGLWAILFWLNILAKTHLSVRELMENFWKKYGRYYYSRYDYEGIETEVATQMIQELTEKLPTLKGQVFNGMTIENADIFNYTDPVTKEISKNQGIRLFFTSGERAIFRTSGTGTQGATIRIYLEKYIDSKNNITAEPQQILAQLIEAVLQISNLEKLTGRTKPSVIT